MIRQDPGGRRGRTVPAPSAYEGDVVDGGTTPDASTFGLPIVGQVYWVQSWIFLDSDRKERRPVVVVRAPRWANDLVVIVERTSTRTDLRGVAHPADPNLGLDRPGVWANRFTRSVEERLFRPPFVELMGPLDQWYLGEVLRMWEEG